MRKMENLQYIGTWQREPEKGSVMVIKHKYVCVVGMK